MLVCNEVFQKKNRGKGGGGGGWVYGISRGIKEMMCEMMWCGNSRG